MHISFCNIVESKIQKLNHPKPGTTLQQFTEFLTDLQPSPRQDIKSSQVSAWSATSDSVIFFFFLAI
jgi:hypothetical protein